MACCGVYNNRTPQYYSGQYVFVHCEGGKVTGYIMYNVHVDIVLNKTNHELG